MNWFKLKDKDRNFVGFFVIGFASLVGGIFMFVFIVLPNSKPISGVPRDVQMIFTNVFSQQNLLKNETGRFSAALVQVGIAQEDCRRYSCLLTLNPAGDDYVFRLSKEGQVWQIRSKSPVPSEVNP